MQGDRWLTSHVEAMYISYIVSRRYYDFFEYYHFRFCLKIETCNTVLKRLLFIFFLNLLFVINIVQHVGYFSLMVCSIQYGLYKVIDFHMKTLLKNTTNVLTQTFLNIDYNINLQVEFGN